MILFPNCKINLGLRILSKRNDGYHNIQTVMYPVPILDILEIVPNKKGKFSEISFSGLEIPGDGKENLCMRAYNLLDQDFNLDPVLIHLHKIIPTGGGLGGGSADATYTLILLNDIFGLKLSNEKIAEYAAKLGSDCPFFVNGGAQLAKGRGEILKPINLDLSGYHLLIYNVGLHISTREAYANVVPQDDGQNLMFDLSQPIEKWKNIIVNDFEKGVFKTYPKLKKTKQQLYDLGAKYAAMSGSGSTMFGLFENKPDFSKLTVPKNGFLKLVKL